MVCESYVIDYGGFYDVKENNDAKVVLSSRVLFLIKC